MCVTDRHDITLAVKVALNPNTTNQLIIEGFATAFSICPLFFSKSADLNA